MNYSLGNMLGGAGALNADKLALNLQFATDKTLTARKGPTPVFTRASTASFVGSNGLIQSAAINAARFDHDPITLACKGLLIEESRTNLFARSAEIGNAYWTNSNLSISSDDQISPDGGLNAETITVSAGTPSIYRAVTCTASTVYTFSFYIKIGTLTPSDFKFAVRDDTNGVFIAENITPNVTPVTTEWRRVTYTFTTPVGCVTVRPYLVRYSYISAGTLFLWGAQLEAGAFPTSYIPTTTASVVRSADVCSISGSDFTGIYNATEGTLLVSADEFRRGTSFGSILRIADSVLPTNNRYSIGAFGSKTGVASPLEFIVASAAITQYTANPTSATSNFKAALAYKVDDMRGAVNGVLATADTPPSALIVTANTINIGGVGIHIASVRYFRKRLPNAKLQTFTV